MKNSLNILIATTGRLSLYNLINSLNVQLNDYDYITIVVDGKDNFKNVNEIIKQIKFNCKYNIYYEDIKLGYWGHGIRNKYQNQLNGDYILHADDDDIYLPGAIMEIKKQLSYNPNVMLLFKFINKSTNNSIWKEPILKLNNIGTPCGVVPNIPEKMGKWEYKYGGDYNFYSTCKFEYKFIDYVIYEVKPNI